MLSAVQVLRRLPLLGRWSTDPVTCSFCNKLFYLERDAGIFASPSQYSKKFGCVVFCPIGLVSVALRFTIIAMDSNIMEYIDLILR